ncbi:MAG TPA: ATP-binding cassette domain-containing protein [Candidatus Baltobacteraceae bacterium]|nr:ATP-binding cassette domain-containing protein [Candidatus Baltobacteraceae bacterium]
MLVARHLRKEFGNVVAVRDVSFSIDNGSTFGLIGPNGAGKTTTMRMILGILTPDGGAVDWNGETISGAMRRRFGYLPEERGLYGRMTVREQIRYFARLHGLSNRDAAERTAEWIGRLGLTANAERPCSELSKGNQQKVQMACATVHGPELLILDEPFSGLDPVNAEMILAVLAELREHGTTLVLSSHQMWQLEEVCDAFCIVSDGENRAAGTLRELRERWPTRVIRVSPASRATRRVLEAIAGARPLKTLIGAMQYEVPSSTSFPEVLTRLVAVEAVTHFEVVEPSLHDIYLHTVESGAQVAS